MAKKINDLTVEIHEVEWGFEFTSEADGEVYLLDMDDEAQARFYESFMDGKVVCREVFITEWAIAPD